MKARANRSYGGDLFRYKLHGYEEDPWAGLTWSMASLYDDREACDFIRLKCEFLASFGR